MHERPFERKLLLKNGVVYKRINEPLPFMVKQKQAGLQKKFPKWELKGSEQNSSVGLVRR